MSNKTIIVHEKRKSKKIDYLLGCLRDKGYSIEGYFIGDDGKNTFPVRVSHSVYKNNWRGITNIAGTVYTIDQLVNRNKITECEKIMKKENADIFMSVRSYSIKYAKKNLEKTVRDFTDAAKKTASRYEKNIVIDVE